jgi:hypothetical protein
MEASEAARRSGKGRRLGDPHEAPRLEIAEQCEASGVYEGIDRITDAADLGSDKHATSTTR